MKGDGNSVNYKYRVHDARLGRFMSIDPLAPEYPWNSPYAFSENRVIDGVELEGLEYLDSDDARVQDIDGKLVLKVENFIGINRTIWNAANENSRNWKSREIGIRSTVASFSLVFPTSMKEARLGNPNNPAADVTDNRLKIEGKWPKRRGRTVGTVNRINEYKVNEINATGGIPAASVPRARGGLEHYWHSMLLILPYKATKWERFCTMMLRSKVILKLRNWLRKMFKMRFLMA